MKAYDHKRLEKKWQRYWEAKKLFHAKESKNQKKFYGLIEFPYPSGSGLHVGHIRSNTAMDIISRKRRMEGYNVLYPIGWDAFGLPTENFAIKTGIHPIKVTKKNTDTFRRQLQALGFSFDWSREVNTTDPKYYKWTQWIFLQFYKKGLAYKAKTEINWCPSCKIGLANEEVVAGACERCGGKVEKREKEQWMLAITKYADRLDKDLDTVNYLDKIKIQQRNWIGKSQGAEIEFKIKEGGSVKVFTTRPDTLYGATYLVLAPEHELVNKLKLNIKNWVEVANYILKSSAKDEIERTNEEKDKTGVELKGLKAINPATNEELPIWVADYVLASYGTGAIMAVPGHDERDFAFAKKYNLPVKQVVEKDLLIDSGRFTGMNSVEAKKKITEFVGGRIVTNYKLRDWVFSRQRYWGEPIPIIHCETCGYVPVPEKDLPVELPKVKKYEPTDTGESPLANIKSWVNVKCPKCKSPAKRETDTMPNWAGSSWYFLRYTDPKNKKEFASPKNLEYWMSNGVDWYNGGMEHTTLHLLYSRFWHKFLYDLKLVPTSEPYIKRTSHGLILADDGTKFSKSKGNGIDPLDLIKIYGADTVRLYEMFMGPFDQAVAWQNDGLVGPRRFIERVWKIADKVGKDSFPQINKLLHKTIKKVSEDIESMQFNTAISSLMILSTEMLSAQEVAKEDYKKLLKILSPFAPHVTEELWSLMGEKKSIVLSEWPKWEEALIVDNEIKIVIQVNGKVRSEIMIKADATENEVKTHALAEEGIKKYLDDKTPKRIIYVKNRLINIVL
jgi:leucyl-tRNA synthetase